jgi:CRP/FNR family transcriptional regulator, polysaccharide utilization system transcription regulator
MKKQLCEIPDCNECDVHVQSIFSDLNREELTEISSNKRGRVYQKGEMVFYAGDRPSGLFCIQQGRVKIYKVGRDGKEQIVRLAQAGDVLGYRSLISGEKYAAFAVPLEEAHICHISKTTINTMLESNYHLASRVLSLLSSDLRAAEEKIVEMAQKPVRERLAETLLVLKETYGLEEDNVTLNMKLTRIELANMVGTATESVSRMLSKMKDEGVIEMRGRKIMIVDHERLVKAANVED